MFIAIKELQRHKLTFQESFPPGTIDFRSREFRQVAPLQVELTAELEGREIHLVGRFSTRLGLNCARCLQALERKISANLDLLYRPVNSIGGNEIELAPEDIEIGFYAGQGLFLADVLAEQIHLALPMKMLCQEACRGLCSGCGASLNRERCRCGPRAVDPRLAPLAAWAEKRKRPS